MLAYLPGSGEASETKPDPRGLGTLGRGDGLLQWLLVFKAVDRHLLQATGGAGLRALASLDHVGKDIFCLVTSFAIQRFLQ